ncbi:putative transposase [Colletotrichum sublineola]|uniref:Putative transposase n=1 Tax=Colletotrichum sublineola TaxID=1173701 RepID=A0A066XBU3_COLSU|nr:putative transposase [Colletotrichum sublineola]
MARPLMSKFINPSIDADTPKAPTWNPGFSVEPGTPQWFSITTPQRSGDLRKYQGLWNPQEGDEDWDHDTRRLLFTKVGKRLDDMNVTIAENSKRIQSLEAQLDRMTKQKKGKVTVDPNTRFANIESIMIAKEKAAKEVAKEAAVKAAKKAAKAVADAEKALLAAEAAKAAAEAEAIS